MPSRSLKVIFVTEEFVVVQMLSNVLEVLAVLHKDVGKAGNRPADVDDGEDDDGDLEKRSFKFSSSCDFHTNSSISAQRARLCCLRN